MNILDIFFAKNCLNCGNLGRYICANCLAKVGTPRQTCPVCGKSSPTGLTHASCKSSNSLDGHVAIWNYRGVIKRAIVAFKYKYATQIGDELEAYILKLLGNIKSPLTNCDNLIPIPLYWYKQNSRGFNQAAQIGKGVANKLGVNYLPNVLVRQRQALPQANLTQAARQQNIKGVFSLGRSAKISPGNYLLFDDVYTTGATLKEACQVLKMGGAKNVWGLTIAKS